MHPDYSGWSIHNYFFARSNDVVKPAGLVMSITSHFTMDALTNGKIREALANKADLVGAIRLPGTTFEKNAGTSVTTDIIILRKKDGNIYPERNDWRVVEEVPTKKGNATVNEYFVHHPEMVLGEHSLEGTMYAGKTEYALLPNKETPLAEQLAKATEQLAKDVIGKNKAEHATKEAARAEELAERGYLTDPGRQGSHSVTSGTMVPPEWANDPKKVQQAKDYIGVRDAATDPTQTMKAEDASDAHI